MKAGNSLRGRITHRLMRPERNGRRASLFAFGLRPKIPLRSVHQKNARTMTLANWSLLYQPRGAFLACPIAALTPQVSARLRGGSGAPAKEIRP